MRRQLKPVLRRFKFLVQLGHLSRHNDDSAKAWLCDKSPVALMADKLICHALAISLWVFDLEVSPTAKRVARPQGVPNPVKREIEPAISLGRMPSPWPEISRWLVESP